MKIRIAIFVSGNGTNCENLIRHFADHPSIETVLVVCNRADAPVLQRIAPYHVPALVTDRVQLAQPQFVTMLQEQYHIHFIVLAGFLLRVPDTLVEAYHRRMVNLHPALLPKFGGKGMYGHHVHEAVKTAGETETGMTLHWVSNEIDGGDIIVQHRTAIEPDDTPEDIARKEHELEMRYLPTDLEQVIVSCQWA